MPRACSCFGFVPILVTPLSYSAPALLPFSGLQSCFQRFLSWGRRQLLNNPVTKGDPMSFPLCLEAVSLKHLQNPCATSLSPSLKLSFAVMAAGAWQQA